MDIFNNLIKENLIDHNLIHFEVPSKKTSSLHLYSINIAQISHVRTMVMFNKINRYLKTSINNNQDYLKKKDVNYIFDNMYEIILKYQMENTEIIEGSKILIIDSNIILDLRELCKCDIEYVYLRKYIPKSKSKLDELFKKRFEKCNYRYFDLVFEEESIEKYLYRITKVFDYLEEITKDRKSILLFQEINPILDFCDLLKKYSCFRIIDPNFSKVEKIHEKIFSKSVNVLVTRNFNHRIYKQPPDQIVHFFSYEGHDKHKNEYQNIKYYLPAFKLNLYNIHSYLYSNKKLLQIMEQQLIEKMKNSSNFIIIGDLNFKLNTDNKKILESNLEKENISCNLYSLPFSENNHEGVIFKLAS